jgi:hypothetical protein
MTVVVGEAISAPGMPSGNFQTDIGVSESYTTGGASSSLGHDLEYRFYWGDGSRSPWSSSSSAPYSWSAEGNYTITARARCAAHPTRMSVWSEGMTVEVGETISIPSAPDGHTTVTVDRIEVYCTGGSSSSRGHPLLYQYDWEGDPFPMWTSANCVSIYWPIVGNFSVRVRARCAEHAEALSAWSEPQLVLISSYEIITTPDIPAGPVTTQVGVMEAYTVSGSYSSSDHRIEFQFSWGDGSQSPWSSSSTASHSWSNDGQYMISIQARCVTHTARISSLSDGLTVNVDP